MKYNVDRSNMLQKVLLFCVLFIVFGHHIALSQELKTKQEALAEIPASWEKQAPLQLQIEITELLGNQHELLITVHGGEDFGRPSVASIYLHAGNKYKLLNKINSSGYFERPNFFRVVPEGATNKEHFIHLTETEYGTSHDNTEHVFYVLPSGEIRPVKFISATESFIAQLNPNEGIWKGELNKFSDEGLFFNFSIWNKGDRNCCPTGAEVSGSYKIQAIEKNTREYIIFAKEYEIHPAINK